MIAQMIVQMTVQMTVQVIVEMIRTLIGSDEVQIIYIVACALHKVVLINQIHEYVADLDQEENESVQVYCFLFYSVDYTHTHRQITHRAFRNPRTYCAVFSLAISHSQTVRSKYLRCFRVVEMTWMPERERESASAIRAIDR